MDGPTECQCGQSGGLWRLSVSLTASGELDLHYTESHLIRALEDRCMSVMVKSGSLLTAEACTVQSLPHNHIT